MHKCGECPIAEYELLFSVRGRVSLLSGDFFPVWRSFFMNVSACEMSGRDRSCYLKFSTKLALIPDKGLFDADRNGLRSMYYFSWVFVPEMYKLLRK